LLRFKGKLRTREALGEKVQEKILSNNIHVRISMIATKTKGVDPEFRAAVLAKVVDKVELSLDNPLRRDNICLYECM